MAPNIDKIRIELEEQPKVNHIEIQQNTINIISSIVGKAAAAQQARLEKQKLRKAAAKSINDAIAELLENPAGLSRAQLLTASDAENIIPLVTGIRRKLKKDNLAYILSKYGKGVSSIYILLDKI